MFAVKRPINGISINGDEWLLYPNGDLMLFTSQENAERYLKKHDIPLDSVDIVDITKPPYDKGIF